MAGYSNTPLIQKLGLKVNSRALFINEPASFKKDLGPNLDDIKPLSTRDFNEKDMQELYMNLDYVHLFSKNRDEVGEFFKVVNKMIKKDGIVWVSWPKKTSGIMTNLDENKVRDFGLAAGLVDVKVAAIDDIWSGLKFVYRMEDRN